MNISSKKTKIDEIFC